MGMNGFILPIPSFSSQQFGAAGPASPCISAAKRPASIKLRQKSSMHTYSNEAKKNPAQRHRVLVTAEG
jgi:hypothetical protein